MACFRIIFCKWIIIIYAQHNFHDAAGKNWADFMYHGVALNTKMDHHLFVKYILY